MDNRGILIMGIFLDVMMMLVFYQVAHPRDTGESFIDDKLGVIGTANYNFVSNSTQNGGNEWFGQKTIDYITSGIDSALSTYIPIYGILKISAMGIMQIGWTTLFDSSAGVVEKAGGMFVLTLVLINNLAMANAAWQLIKGVNN